MSADVYRKHRSHVSSKRASASGWSRVPPFSARAETYSIIEEASKNFMSDNYYTWTDSSTSGSTGATDYFQVSPITFTPYVTWINNWPTTEPRLPLKDQFKQLEEKIKLEAKEVTKMGEQRTLFRVYVVDPRKGGKILMNGEPIIAANENQAMLKVGVGKVAGEVGLDLEQVDVYVEEVATFIRPRKETGRVKIVKDDDEE